MQKQTLKTFSLALLGTSVLVPAVAAQDSDQVMAVYDRHRPELSAEGVRSGGFLFRPEIEAQGKFDSNIYADNANEEDDFIAIIKPSFRMDSNWNNNSLSFFADAEIAKYSDNGSEDYEDFNIGASGRLDISRGSNVFFDLSYADEHEDRGSPDSPGSQAEQTKYSVLTAVAGFKRDEGIISFAVDGSYIKNDYDDAALVGGGTLENDHRDRETLKASVRLGYELNPEYEAFVKLTTTKVDYENSRLTGGPLRDNDGWDVVGGMAFKIGGKSEGEVYAGYVKRDYDSATLAANGNVSDFKFGASVLWAGDLSSVRLSVDRDVTETVTRPSDENPATVDPYASGILSTSFSVRAEHELRRNLLLSADASYNKMDFVGTFRNDDIFKIGAGMRYLLNRNFSLNADYLYDDRASNQRFSDYDRHSFIVSLSAQW